MMDIKAFPKAGIATDRICNKAKLLQDDISR